MTCRDIDGEECQLSDVRMGEDTLSPLEMCYKKQMLATPMKGVGGTIFDGVGWIVEHPIIFLFRFRPFQKSEKTFQFWIMFQEKQIPLQKENPM